MPGSSHGGIQVTGADCLLLYPSRFAGWLLCSFLPREESGYSPAQFLFADLISQMTNSMKSD